uniref:Uncharacterized protein n=1 Tax=Steinernema glaseri TaxID=37863 RepID=A0A1I7ZMG2_9BILA
MKNSEHVSCEHRVLPVSEKALRLGHQLHDLRQAARVVLRAHLVDVVVVELVAHLVKDAPRRLVGLL